MLRTQVEIVVAALVLGVIACENSKPAKDASEIDMGSGKSPQTADAGSDIPLEPKPAPDDSATPGNPTGDHDTTPKPGGGSAPGSGSPAPG